MNVKIGMLVGLLLAGGILAAGMAGSKHIRFFVPREDLPVSPQLQEIIYYGTLAPSSHNAQMWKVRVDSDSEITVLLDKSRLLPGVDPANREALISLGAFVENMIQTAPKFDLTAQVSVVGKKPADEEMVRIKFNKGSGNEFDPAFTDTVIKRDTVRTPYQKTALSAGDVKVLQNTVGDNLYYFPLDSEGGRYIREGLIASNKQQAYDDEKQKELADWVRFDKKEAVDKNDGLTPEMMGLSGVKKYFVYTFMNKDSVMADSFRKQTVSTVQSQVDNCAGFFIITSRDNSVEGLINVGRDLQKFWHRATELQVAIHPMSQMMEESPWKEENNGRLNIDKPMHMMLRVGYVDELPQPVSKRRNIEEIIIIDCTN